MLLNITEKIYTVFKNIFKKILFNNYLVNICRFCFLFTTVLHK